MYVYWFLGCTSHARATFPKRAPAASAKLWTCRKSDSCNLLTRSEDVLPRRTSFLTNHSNEVDFIEDLEGGGRDFISSNKQLRESRGADTPTIGETERVQHEAETLLSLNSRKWPLFCEPNGSKLRCVMPPPAFFALAGKSQECHERARRSFVEQNKTVAALEKEMKQEYRALKRIICILKAFAGRGDSYASLELLLASMKIWAMSEQISRAFRMIRIACQSTLKQLQAELKRRSWKFAG